MLTPDVFARPHDDLANAICEQGLRRLRGQWGYAGGSDEPDYSTFDHFKPLHGDSLR
jgi:hypothetical protein